jgi:hypothetical protein
VRFSWGAVFAGVVAALGVWILLYALGLALGLSTINPEQSTSMRGSGIFTGIWSLLVPLIALFVGGMVAGRGSGPVTRFEGSLHGLIVWGMTTLVGFWMVVSFFGAVVSGAGEIGRTVFRAGAQMGEQGPVSFDFDKALQPINERLRSEGKPEVTADELQATLGDVVSGAVAGGQLDREAIVVALSSNTALTEDDANEIADNLQAQLSQAGRQVQTKALKAADTTGKVFWGVFGALFLGLVASMLGGFAGVSRREREVVTTNVPVTR